MDNGLLRQLFQAEIGEVDAALAARLSQAGDDGPWPHVRYHLGIEGGVMMPRGKRLRAIFCLLIGRAARTPASAVRVLMLASELGHAASLIHDDIQDGETIR